MKFELGMVLMALLFTLLTCVGVALGENDAAIACAITGLTYAALSLYEKGKGADHDRT